MESTAKVLRIGGEAQSSVQNARVVSVSDGRVFIRAQDRTWEAKLAFSCLVRPVEGDLAMCAMGEDGAYYVLGILERPGKQDMTISFPADTVMVADEGALSMASKKNMTLAAGDSLNCFSERVLHKSREAVVDYNDLTARGRSLQAGFHTVVFVSKSINTFAKQVIAKAKSYIRRTESYDRVKAGQMTKKVEGLYSMDSQNTIMLSRNDTKIDGEHIFMG